MRENAYGIGCRARSQHSYSNPALAFHAQAGFRHLCWDKPISHSNQYHMHIHVINTLWHEKVCKKCQQIMYVKCHVMTSKLLVVSKMSKQILICLRFKNILASIWRLNNVLLPSYRRVCVFHFQLPWSRNWPITLLFLDKAYIRYHTRCTRLRCLRLDSPPAC